MCHLQCAGQAHRTHSVLHRLATQRVDAGLAGDRGLERLGDHQQFIQTDAVSERVLARTVVVSLREGDAPISDEQTLTFDSASQLLDERKRSVFLTVLAGAHDPHRRYDLVMRDAITKVEVLRLPIKVDLAFGSDF